MQIWYSETIAAAKKYGSKLFSAGKQLSAYSECDPTKGKIAMYLKDCDELTSKQKEEISKEIFYMHECIRTQKWEALNSGIYRMECLPDDVLYEINNYFAELSKVTFCGSDTLSKTIRPGRCKGTTDKWETLSLIWLNGQESDLSMMCEFTFKGETIIAAVLEEVHVF